MKLIEIPDVPPACNAADIRKKTCRFGVVREVAPYGRIQDMHDAFAEVKRPDKALAAVQKEGKWFWAVDDGVRIPSDNLP